MAAIIFFLRRNWLYFRMKQSLIIIAQKIGIDKAIAYSSGSGLVGGIAGVFSVFFISTYLTGVEQGYYYTFGSILAMQLFLELGLNFVMIQFVAHEVSHLSLDENNEYVGDERYRSRLASLVHLCTKWYLLLSILIFIFLMILGNIYFVKYGNPHSEVTWRIPWLLICIGTSLKTFQSPFTSIIMGLGKVKEMSKIGFYQVIILPLSSWLGLFFGLKLYVMGISYLISIMIWQVYVYKKGFYDILIKLWQIKISDRISYVKEIFPYHWKIAMSSVSGYFIFQFFNPVLFATEGPVVAGQMGMTMQALNAIQGLSLNWLNTKIPLFSKLIALGDYVQLDSIFNKTVKQMTSICLFLLLLFLGIIVGLNYSQLKFGQSILADRFLPYFPMILLMLTVFLNQYTNSWATYLRCHKAEPFLWISVIGAIADACSTLFLGKMYGLYGITIGYTTLAIFFFPWGYRIYKTKKAEWHNNI